MYESIQVKEIRGIGADETATLEVTLSVGDQIRMCTNDLIKPEYRAITVMGFEPGSGRRKVILMCSDGDKLHMHGEGLDEDGIKIEGDTLDVWREREADKESGDESKVEALTAKDEGNMNEDGGTESI